MVFICPQCYKVFTRDIRRLPDKHSYHNGFFYSSCGDTGKNTRCPQVKEVLKCFYINRK